MRATRVSYSDSHAGYPATDIFCPIGSQFVAPVDGFIHFVNRTDAWNPKIDDPATRGGLAVAMIGTDGWRYYGSHLSAIEPELALGSCVTAGQPLGRIGTSGNARGKTPHLHFGISIPSAPSDWKGRRGQINPYPLLKLWERSKGRIPLAPRN
ncbi:MAG: M23 family metallopeptidase [Thermoanaerobaculia bacterium]